MTAMVNASAPSNGRPKHDTPAGLSAANGVAQKVPQRLAHAHPVEVHVQAGQGMPPATMQPGEPGIAAAAVRLCGEQLVDRARFEGEPQLTTVGLR